MINVAASGAVGYFVGKFVAFPLAVVVSFIAHSATGSGGATVFAFFATFIGVLYLMRRRMAAHAAAQHAAELEAEKRQAKLVAEAILAAQKN